MDDQTLLNISLTVTFIGITALLIMTYYDGIPEKDFNEITSEDAGSRVRVSGTINAIYMHNSSMTLKLEQRCIMDVFLFEKNVDLIIGDNITAEGTAQEYDGKMEIMADRIKKVTG